MGIAVVHYSVAALLLVTFRADLSRAASWSYDGEKGPYYWHELFPQACSGKYQSPIDIKSEQTMYNPNLKDFAIWYDPPRPGSTMTVLNNGHTVQCAIKGEFYVANGGLPNVYKTAQFHFHWGHAKHHGSEHLIDGKAYPLELHIVNYNSDMYDDIGAAVQEKQGLAVLGVMFQETDEDNEDLKNLLDAMEQVRDPDDNHEVEVEPMSIRNLLPDDISSYYRYNGSLTTPGCFESVVWTVFAHPKRISNKQMRKFREMLQNKHSRHGERHRRSSDLPVDKESRGRERRALRVLDELALTSEEQSRLRRDLTAKQQHADVTINENQAGQAHKDMLDAVHDAGTTQHDDHSKEGVSEVEIEYIQEKMVNNFRPVQPLNDRIVYRSFKLGTAHQPRPREPVHVESEEARAKRIEEAESRLKYFQSVDSGATSVLFSSTIHLSCLLSLFLFSLFLL